MGIEKFLVLGLILTGLICCSEADGACFDLDDRCSSWGDKGECEKNIDWMAAHCPVSCNTCDCKNLNSIHDQCYVWRKQGECEKNPTWMASNCRLTCGKCRELLPKSEENIKIDSEVAQTVDINHEQIPEQIFEETINIEIAEKNDYLKNLDKKLMSEEVFKDDHIIRTPEILNEPILETHITNEDDQVKEAESSKSILVTFSIMCIFLSIYSYGHWSRARAKKRI